MPLYNQGFTVCQPARVFFPDPQEQAALRIAA